MAPRPRNLGSRDLPANLYKKKDSRSGITYFTYRDPVSGRCFGLGKDKEQAVREAMAANFADAARPTLTERLVETKRPTSRLFSAWIEEYRGIYLERGLAANSVRTALMRLKRLDAEFGANDIRDISTMMIANYLGAMAKEGKAQMARAMRSLMRDVFMEAMAAGWADANPVDVTRAARVVIKRERLTLDLWKEIYAEAKQPWLRRAMELAVLTGQRREDIANMVFKDEHDGYLHVVQSKTKTRLRISTSIRLECLDLELGAVIKQCRDRVVSQHLIHHSRTISLAKAGSQVWLDTISKEFSSARKRAAARLGLDLGKTPPTFHEMRSLAARLHAAEGRDPQQLLGHRSAKMTDMYRDIRGAEWIDVA